MSHLMGVLLACLLVACDRDNPDRFISSGQAYLATKDYPAAIIQFKNAVQRAPDNGEARYLLGTALKEGGDLRSAEIEYRKAVDAGYSSHLVYPALARVLLMRGEFDKALAETTREVGDTEAKAELRALGGQAQLGRSKLTEARDAFLAALELSPGNATAMVGMARLAAMEGDLEKAEASIDALLRESPNLSEALLLKGDLLAARGLDQEAVTIYDKAITSDPRAAQAYLAVVPLLLKQGKIPAARERVEAMKLTLPQRPATFYVEALVAYAERNLPAARDAVLAALRLAPDHVPTLALAGAIEHDAGAYGNAQEHLKRALLGSPESPSLRRLLASTYLRSGETELAEQQVAWLLKREPENANVHALAGEVSLATRDLDRAAQHFNNALALDPKNIPTRVRLGQTRFAAGDVTGGIRDLELASGADARQYQADVALVLLRLRQRKLDDALAAAEVLTKKQPDNPLSYNLRGLIRIAKKEDERARAEFEHALKLQPTYFPAAGNLASMDLRSGAPDAAKQHFDRILAVNAKHEQALLARIELLQRSGTAAAELGKAINDAVTANPQSIRIRLLQIAHAGRQGDRKLMLTKALDANAAIPNDARLLGALGRAQLANGDTNQAVATFSKVASLLPKSPAPLLAQADAFTAMNDWDSARRALNRAIELQPDSIRLRVALLQNSVRAGQLDRALSEARDLQRRWPKNAAGFLAEANILHTQGKTAEAERTLRQALSQQPASSTLLAATVALLSKQGKKDAAEALATTWIREHPRDVAAPSLLAAQSTAVKDYPGAVRWYRAALDVAPNNAVILNNLAWALGQMKNRSAIDYARQAAKLAPNNPAVLDTLGWLEVENGQVDEGLELLARAHSLAPAAEAIRLNLAKALLKAGRQADARVHLDALTKLPEGSASRKEAEALLARG